MIFTETSLHGAYVIELEPIVDKRGYFSRSFCKREFEELGLCTDYVQHSISYNTKMGTLRGLHYQQNPYGEVKIIQCVKGCIFDVIVDIREDSDTYLKSFFCQLNESNKKMLYVPKGFAHGFQTLEDHSEVLYMMSEYHEVAHAKTIKYDNAEIAIDWPIKENIIISDKDNFAI